MLVWRGGSYRAFIPSLLICLLECGKTRTEKSEMHLGILLRSTKHVQRERKSRDANNPGENDNARGKANR
jgi:hypothetical protein